MGKELIPKSPLERLAQSKRAKAGQPEFKPDKRQKDISEEIKLETVYKYIHKQGLWGLRGWRIIWAGTEWQPTPKQPIIETNPIDDWVDNWERENDSK